MIDWIIKGEENKGRAKKKKKERNVPKSYFQGY